MSWQTAPFVIALRNFLRRAGITKLIREFTGPMSYEEAFKTELLGAIRPGDCVWDVGANVGYYTVKFCEAVCSQGQVIAFEPNPVSRDRLRDALIACENVTIRPEALGSAAGRLRFSPGRDPLGATSKVNPAGFGEDDIVVPVEPGDDLINAGLVPMPNVIKIDTEGFEREVIVGLSKTLTSPVLHTIAVEVHFGLLVERGQPGAPTEIEAGLRSAGFSTHWADASHIVGRRP
jgi:FkbM family methyltransferase